jgi:hypothetical protein
MFIEFSDHFPCEFLGTREVFLTAHEATNFPFLLFFRRNTLWAPLQAERHCSTGTS